MGRRKPRTHYIQWREVKGGDDEPVQVALPKAS